MLGHLPSFGCFLSWKLVIITLTYFTGQNDKEQVKPLVQRLLHDSYPRSTICYYFAYYHVFLFYAFLHLFMLGTKAWLGSPSHRPLIKGIWASQCLSYQCFCGSCLLPVLSCPVPSDGAASLSFWVSQDTSIPRSDSIALPHSDHS